MKSKGGVLISSSISLEFELKFVEDWGEDAWLDEEEEEEWE